MKRYLQLNELLCLRHLADHGPCTLAELFAASKQFPTLATSMIEDGLTYGYTTDESPLYRIAITDEGGAIVATTRPFMDAPQEPTP